MQTSMILSAAALILLLATGTWAQPAPYSLGAAVDAALGRSPVLQGAGDRVREAEAGLKEARMGRLPSLSVNSAFTRGDNPVYVFGTLLEQKAFTQSDFDVYSLNNPALRSNFKNSVELGVPLFTGFELSNLERLGRLGKDAAQSGKESASQGVRYAVLESFLEVVHRRQLSEELGRSVESSQAEVESARKLRAKGLVLGSDYYAAEAVLGGLRAWRSGVDAGLEAAKARLAVLLGSAPKDLQVRGGLSAADYPMEPEADLLSRALRDRPELRQAGLRQDMASVMRRRAGASILPKVEAFASVETDTRDFDANPWNRLFGVRASLPLGDPGYLPRRAKAQAALEASRADAESAKEQVTSEVAQAYRAFQGARDTLPIAKETMDTAQRSLEMFRPLYREGRQSILEVLRAEEGLAKARAAYLDNVRAVHEGRARLLLAAGGLDAQAVREIEKNLEASR